MNAILSLDDEPEMVFMRNDPMFVESIHLPDSVTKRKPDVVLVEIESGKKWLGVEASGTFQQCREEAGEVKSKEEGKGEAKGKSKGKGKPKGKPKGKATAEVGKGKAKAKAKAEVGKGEAEVKQKEKRGWMPIEQFWEFKMFKNLKGLSTRLETSFDMNSLTPSASGAPAGESFIHMP